MNRRQKWLTGAGTAFVLLLAVGCATPTGNGNQAAGNGPANVGAQPTVASTVPTVGKTAPSFSLPTLNGSQTVSLQGLLGKRPILLNAWASWCGPCNQETPDLVKLSKQYGTQVQFVGVDLTSLDTVAQAKAFVINYHIPYTVLSDVKGQFDKSYAILSIPTTYVISSKGTVVAVHIGSMTNKMMNSLVQQAIQAG